MSNPAFEDTPLWRRFLHTLGTGERLGTKYLLAPYLESAHPEAYQRLLESGQEELYGGDIYRALRPNAGRIEALLGGTALGAVVDPLTYIGGGLTKAGKVAQVAGAARSIEKTNVARQAAKAALDVKGIQSNLHLPYRRVGEVLDQTLKQAPPLEESWLGQIQKGQRNLLHLRLPGMEELGSVSLLPRSVQAGMARAGGAVQRGRVLEEMLPGVVKAAEARKYQGLDPSRLYQAIKFVDDAGMRFAQAFNVPVGVNRWLWVKWKGMLSATMGRADQGVQQFSELFEPELATFAKELAERFGMKPQVAREKLNRVLLESATQTEDLWLGPGATVIKGKRPDMVKDIFDAEFGPPPAMGGPASLFDTTIDRKLREQATKYKAEYDAIRLAEEDKLGKAFNLMRRSDQDYHLNLMTTKAKQVVREIQETILGDIPRRMGRQTTKQGGKRVVKGVSDPSGLHRRMRFIDPDELERLKPTLGKAVYNSLSKSGGAVPSRKAMKEIELLYKKGKLTDTDVVGLLPPMSMGQANQWVFEKGIGMVPARTIPKWFDDNPTALLAARGMRADRAMLSQELFDEMKLRPDLMVDEATRNADPLKKHWQEAKIPELKGYYVHPDSARWLNRMWEAETRMPSELNSFFRLYKQSLERWKSWTLSVFPVYHTRNFMGNLWNYHLGSPNVKEAGENLVLSQKVYWSLRNGKTLKIKSYDGKISYDAAGLWDYGYRQGIFGSGFLTPDDPANVQQAVRQYGMLRRLDPLRAQDPETLIIREFRRNRGKSQWAYNGIAAPPYANAAALQSNPFSKDEWYTKLGFRVAGHVDNYVRMAHLLQKVREGMPLEAAVQSVKHHFFDYHDLSATEKVLREVFPFFSWSRKNIPFQLESIITRPDRVARFGSALQSYEGWDTPEEERHLNAWMKENFPLRIRRGKDGRYEYFVFRGWLPLADIHDLIHPLHWATFSLNPLPRAVFEQAFNINFFTRRKIDYLNSLYNGERVPYGPVKLPARLAHVVRGFRPTNALYTMLENPQEIPFWERLIQYFVGRFYPLSPDQSLLEFQRELAKVRGDAARAFRSAARKGEDMDELRRILLRGQEMQQETMRNYGYGPEEK